MYRNSGSPVKGETHAEHQRQAWRVPDLCCFCFFFRIHLYCHGNTQSIVSPSGSCTCLMLSRVVRDFHGIHLQALVAFSNVVDPGDVGALFIYHLHHLNNRQGKNTRSFNTFNCPAGTEMLTCLISL